MEELIKSFVASSNIKTIEDTTIDVTPEMLKRKDCLPNELKLLHSYTSEINQWFIYSVDPLTQSIDHNKLDIDFIMYSMEKILSGIEYTLINYKHSDIIDIGHLYRGMGHYCVLAWCSKINKYFFRYDGGSNGYEREHNELFFLTKFDPSDEKYKEKLINFENTIKMIREGISKSIIVHAE